MLRGTRLRLTMAAGVLVLGVVGVSAALAGDSGGGDRVDVGSAVLRNAEGARVGRVLLFSYGGQTRVTVQAHEATGGFHGFHVHAVGICDPSTTDPAGNPAPFLSAGGHFNPFGVGHGSHAGDMPPLLVGGGGDASATFVTDRYTLTDLLDADGSAIIVHAGADNLANIPTRYQSSASSTPGPDAMTLATGDAGGRFACGVVHRYGRRR
jgi:Cu-Zn family superoxide dismutase